MSNVFIRTNIAPYRIDTYNALYKRLDMKMCFYNRVGKNLPYDNDKIESQCLFKPKYFNGITFKNSNRKLCFGLWRMLWKEKPNIVIVPEFQISTVQVLLFRFFSHRKFKVVSMTDDSYDMIANDNDFTKLHAWLRNHFAKFFDNFIVVTPQVQEWYQERYNKGIWLPIIMDEQRAIKYYQSLLPISRQYVEDYNLLGKKILLYVGRLVEVKNLHRVIDAFSLVETDATLIIIGDGPERDSLIKHAESVDKEIIFPGQFNGDQLYSWYNLASVFILNSFKEAFGAVTNEALISGCRVIVSKKAGSSCLVTKDNGELVNPMNEIEIAKAIERQLSLAGIPDLTSSRLSKMSVFFGERIDNLIRMINN